MASSSTTAATTSASARHSARSTAPWPAAVVELVGAPPVPSLWEEVGNDPQAHVGRLPAVLAQGRSQDRQAPQPRHLPHPRRRRAPRARRPVFQASLTASKESHHARPQEHEEHSPFPPHPPRPPGRLPRDVHPRPRPRPPPRAPAGGGQDQLNGLSSRQSCAPPAD